MTNLDHFIKNLQTSTQTLRLKETSDNEVKTENKILELVTLSKNGVEQAKRFRNSLSTPEKQAQLREHGLEGLYQKYQALDDLQARFNLHVREALKPNLAPQERVEKLLEVLKSSNNLMKARLDYIREYDRRKDAIQAYVTQYDPIGIREPTAGKMAIWNANDYLMAPVQTLPRMTLFLEELIHACPSKAEEIKAMRKEIMKAS